MPNENNGPVASQNCVPGGQYAGFTCLSVDPIPELRSQGALFEHARSGARLFHLRNDDPNNLFAIAFRTPVSDDTGAPHIMEHSVLCGSRLFPLRDPFLELLKGSLQTFLNAFTYPDKTVYPVSSQVEKDFFNLVKVYCDAVLHPLISPNTFFQEGWHYEISEESGPVNISGIVYNEMKGVFSDFASHVSRRTLSALLPDTTYRFESGGDPAAITDLTYELFTAFHKRFYHPSNSFIFLYGNIPTLKTLSFLDTVFLGDFTREPAPSHIAPQPLWREPRAVTIQAPSSPENDGSATILLAWLTGATTDPDTVLAGRIAARYLLGTESSPLKRALIDSGLGEDLDEACGYMADLVQGVFIAGLRKSKAERSEAVAKVILDTLRKIVENGPDEQLLEGCIRQTEFKLREITSGGHFPYNIMLAERCFQSWIYGGDPAAHLKFEAPLTRIKEPGHSWFAEYIKTHLLDNPHRLLSVIIASTALGKQLARQTEELAARKSAHFTDADRTTYRVLTKELLREQRTQPSEAARRTLPRLTKNDLPPENLTVETLFSNRGGVVVHGHPIFTSGIVYLDIGFNLGAVSAPLVPYLPLFAELLCRAGAANSSYQEMATRIALATGGLSSSLVIGAGGSSGEPPLVRRCFIHTRALESRVDEMSDLLCDLLRAPVLDNQKQIRDLLLEMRNDFMAAIMGEGHRFALTHAGARLCVSRHYDELVGGLSQVRFLERQLAAATLDDCCRNLREIYSLVVNRHNALVVVTAENPDRFFARAVQPLGALAEREPAIAPPPHSDLPAADDFGIEISTAVNYAARAWKLPELDAQEIGLLHLAARVLSTGYLWNKVRVEGG
ncbi:MAG: insulinase family protein, partial [Chitinivibrionales bacterium]|nr:insulinase family protein [Chitinivibrionales bacterium]